MIINTVDFADPAMTPRDAMKITRADGIDLNQFDGLMSVSDGMGNSGGGGTGNKNADAVISAFNNPLTEQGKAHDAIAISEGLAGHKDKDSKAAILERKDKDRGRSQ